MVDNQKGRKLERQGSHRRIDPGDVCRSACGKRCRLTYFPIFHISDFA